MLDNDAEKKIDEEWKRQVREEKLKHQREHEKSKARAKESVLQQEASFTGFIATLSTQALIHMGIIENPLTGEKTQDLAQAKYIIDLLQIIEEKTKGNLTKEEELQLSNVLHELRLAYVKITTT
jgi:hypothetical protein